MTETYSIPSFPISDEHFEAWDGLVGAASVAAGIAVAHQVLNPVQFTNVYPEQTFVSLTNPGPPIYLSTLSVAQIPNYSVLVKDHDRRIAAYNAEKTSISRFLTELLKCLPPDLRLLTEKHERSFAFTIKDCMKLLRVKFATLTPAKVLANAAILSEPYSPGVPLSTHFAKHDRSHIIAKDNHAGLAAFTKFHLLAQSMKVDPYFADSVGDFEKQCPCVEQQTFRALTAFLLLREGIRPITAPVTATTMGFTASATISSPVPTGRPRPSATPPSRYCWSHGLTHHSGTHCKNPKPGHLAQATLQDRMGGNDKGCP